MKFHEILRQRRLALGLTQEQLAQRLGVSAPAVNKWERNNSYPDITLLPPLARLLEVDLNTLLSFQEELTEEEIGAFANVLGERAQQEGCEAAFRLARDKLREYPNSDLLAYTAAQILDGALVLWKRGENDPEREQAWKGEILALYRRCADSGDRRVRERAERMLISQYMAQGELEQAEEQLARLPQEDRERPMLEAMLRRKQKRSEEAWPILERELFRQASDLQSTLMALMDLALEAGDKTCARQYSETAEQAGRVFQLTAYAVASAPLQLALAEQDGPEALAVLERLLRSLEEPWDLSASPLYRHLPTKEAAREVQQIMLQYLLEELDVTTPTGFSTSHVTNPVMVTGTLPYDKEKMLEGIYAMLGTGKESDLHGIVSVSDAAVER